MLSETSQTKKDIYYMILHVESKNKEKNCNKKNNNNKAKLINRENTLVIGSGGGWGWWVGEKSEGGQKVQTSSYKN